MIDDSEQFYTQDNDIYRVLRALQLSRSLLQVRFSSDTQPYNSLLIDVDFDQKQFVIDALTPDSGNEKLQEGATFTLIGYYDGVQVACRNNQVLPTLPELHVDAFAVSFPAEVFYKQRRHHFRTSIPRARQGAASLLSASRPDALSGRLVDLSIAGFGIELAGQPQPPITRSEHFRECRLSIPGELEISSACIAHNPRYDPVRQVTQCGFELVNPAAATLRKLERYTLQLQREQRRLGQASTAHSSAIHPTDRQR